MKASFFYAVGIFAIGSLFVGCQTVLRPSGHSRELSFAQIQGSIKSAYAGDLRSTYFVFASDVPLKIALSGTESSFHLDIDKPSHSAVAIGITGDGYLLTAAHVAARYTYVVGYMDGHVCSILSRVVSKAWFREFGAEYAVLKIDRSIDRPCKLAGENETKTVYGIGVDRRKGLWLELLGGKVRSRKSLSDGAGGTLVLSDLPLWYGDSGGPLFSPEGSLIGINTAFRFEIRDWTPHYDRYSFAPNPKRVEDEIVKDRLNSKPANQALEPMPLANTPRACARVAPAKGMAHL